MSAHYAQIKEICDALYDTKEGLSLDRIFEQTQLPKSEVIIHYKTWRSEAANDSAQVNLDPNVNKQTFSNEFLDAFKNEVSNQAEVLNKATKQQLEFSLEIERNTASSLQESEHRITQLTGQLSELEASITQQESQYQDTIADLQKTLETTTIELTNTYESKITQLDESNKSNINELTQSFDTKLNALTQENESITLASKGLEETISEIKTSTQQQLNDKEHHHALELANTKTQFENHISENKQIHQQQTSELEENFGNQLSELASRHELASTSTTERYESKLLELSQNLEAQSNKLSEQHNQSTQQLTHDYEAKITDLTQSKESHITQAKESFTAEITELNNQVSTKTELLAATTQTLNETQIQYDELQSQLSESKNDLQLKTVTLDDALEAKTLLQTTLKQTEARIYDLKEQNTSANEHNQSLNDTLKSQKETVEKAQQLSEAAKTALQNMKQENQKLIEQMSFIRNNSTSTLERLTNKSEQAITKIKTLEEKLTGEQTASYQVKSDNERLMEQLEFIKQNSSTTFERLTKSAEQAMAKVRVLEKENSDLKDNLADA
jgi:chromosome segregation ATPase